MPRDKPTDLSSASNSLVSAAVIVGALHFGRDILLPFALSILLSFLLAPLVERLEKWKVGRVPSVLAVVTIALLSFGALGLVLAHQVYDLAYRLPEHKKNILAKIQTFQGDGTGVLARLTKSVDDMRATLSAPPGQKPAGDVKDVAKPPVEESQRLPTAGPPLSLPGEQTVPPQPPIRVEVVESLSAQEIAQGVLGPLISPLASAAIVIVFLIFMLLKREDLRNRFIQLVGGERLNVTTQALDDAGRRISRYLLMQLIINSAYGLVICAGLLLIGMPNALLWGALTAMLRFVPYIGPWIAAVMPIAISLAVFDGWLQPALVLGLFIVNELISNNFIEPWLYGSSTGISTIGILASAVFWTWIWGPIGLVLATPLTVCLTVVGRHVPQLAFFNVMLSDQETLAPHSRFYQRLLALDPEEATEVAEEYLATTSLADLYDTVLLPALSLAEQDRHRGNLDDAKEQFILQATREIVDDIGERIAKATDEVAHATERAPCIGPAAKARVLCLPARDEADELAGMMLVQLLCQRGIAARVISTKTLSGEMLDQVEAESCVAVCVSALPPFAATHARYLSKRLKLRFPHLRIVVGLWQTVDIGERTRERLTATGIDMLVTTLADAVKESERASQSTIVESAANSTAI
jgi:predicted PurR-regulated permease PerM